MILAGELALWVAALLAAWSMAFSVAGWRIRSPLLRDSAALAAYAAPIVLLVAAAGLAAGLVANDFTLRHVAEHSSLNTPWVYRVSAAWAGVDGSLLLWCIALATHGALMTRVLRRRGDPAAPIATAITSGLLLVLVGILLLVAYPFSRLEWGPPDGAGLAPELQDPAMALHPPLLQFGYGAAVVPFAVGVASLVADDASGAWRGITRRWATAAWALLTAAILLGMRWALVTPGWDGLWQWEPVQVLVLLAWVMAAGLAHMRPLAARGAVASRLLAWGAVLWLPLVLLGLAAAHAGESGGRHAFRSSPAEAPLVVLLLVVAVAAIAVPLWRGDALARIASDPRASASRWRPATIVTHAGLLLLAIGLAAQGASRTYRIALQPAHSVELTDPFGAVWTLLSQGESRDRVQGREVTLVAVQLSRGGRARGLLTPAIRQEASPDGESPGRAIRDVATSSTPLMEMAVMLEDLPTPVAGMVVEFHPLLPLVWIGGLMTVIGVSLSLITATSTTQLEGAKE